MAEPEAIEVQDRGPEAGTGLAFARAGRARPRVERRRRDVLGRADRWIERQRWLIEHPARTTALVTAGAGGLAAAVGGAGAAVVVGLAIPLVHLLVRASELHSRRRRDRELASALENLVQGLHIGLPTQDELSVAFEAAARGIEERLLASVRTRQAELEQEAREARAARDDVEERLATASQELEELREESSATEETIRALETERDEARARVQQLDEALAADRDRLRQEQERFQSQREALEQSNETLREDLRAAREAAQGETETLRQEVEAARERAERAEEEREGLRASLEEARRWAQEETRALGERLEAARNDAEAARSRLEQESAELRGGLEAARADADAARSRAEDEAREWQAEAERLKERLEAAETHAGEAERARHALEKELEAQRSGSAERRREVEQELQRLRTELDDSRAEVQRLAAESERLRSMSQTIDEEEAGLFDRIAGKLRSPVQLAARQAHELATTLAQQAGGEAREDAHKAAEILRCVARVDRLLGQVVDLGKLDAAGWKSVFTEVDSRRLILNCLAEHQEAARRAEVRIEEDLPIDLPRIRTDPRLVESALREILENAVTYTGTAGRIDVSARIGPRAGSEGEELSVRVRDTGTGIAPGDLKRIFEPFERADARPRFRASDTGAGLGLTLARRRAGLLGGRIEVESEPGRGSTFTLAVPVRVAAAA